MGEGVSVGLLGPRRITHNRVADLYPDWQPLP